MAVNRQHYGKEYFDWQSPMGEFGGWADLTKFLPYINVDDIVMDFGCGGGFLLNNIQCRKKIGVDVNPTAIERARQMGIMVYESTAEIADNSLDVVISTNALEHTLHPYQEVAMFYQKLKPGGKIILVVPCESITYRYKMDDVNMHLYSWSPMCLGNLLTTVGFRLIESKPYIHKWPPYYQHIARLGGRKVFDVVCRIFGMMERSWFQVRAIAKKPI